MEKGGGAAKPLGVLDLFWDTCQACDLWDIEFRSNDFTWWNGREGDHSVEERLDRFLASTSWSVCFPWAEVLHLDEVLSDHLPILLKLNLKDISPKKKKERRFKFENMWALEPSCAEVIGEKWNESFDPNPIRNVQEKAAMCARGLLDWNATRFGNIQAKIREKERQLRGLSDPDV